VESDIQLFEAENDSQVQGVDVEVAGDSPSLESGNDNPAPHAAGAAGDDNHVRVLPPETYILAHEALVGIYTPVPAPVPTSLPDSGAGANAVYRAPAAAVAANAVYKAPAVAVAVTAASASVHDHDCEASLAASAAYAAAGAQAA
jgi:hypothetical protein